jgi:hypothetical protein
MVLKLALGRPAGMTTDEAQDLTADIIESEPTTGEIVFGKSACDRRGRMPSFAATMGQKSSYLNTPVLSPRR